MNDAPKRLISLAPTQTEIIAALGSIGNLVGVTEDCDYPESVKTIPRFGSWYSPDLDAVLKARPDLVFTFGSHHEEVAAALMEKGIPVCHGDPPTIAASMDSMAEIAGMLGLEEKWAGLAASLEQRLAIIKEKLAAKPGRRPAVLRIMHWDPLIMPGPGAFQHDVIEFSGGRNVAGYGPGAYFICKRKLIIDMDPEIIFFCHPEVKDLLEADPAWRNVSAVRSGRTFLFDCGLTCRSGPRIVGMAEKLSEIVLECK